MDLANLLKIKHPSEEDSGVGQVQQWSAYDVCEGWAIKRGFMTKRAARPDVARAANHLLRSYYILLFIYSFSHCVLFYY